MFDAEIIAAIVGVLGTLLGGAASTDLAVRLITQIFKGGQKEALEAVKIDLGDKISIVQPEIIVGNAASIATVKCERFDVARNHLLKRLAEAKAQQKRNNITAQVLRFSSSVLTATQIIVGTVMTTALIKNLLSPLVIGIFGIVVIVSSSINQKFSPGVGAQIAFQQSDLFKALIRDTENKLVIIETETDQTVDDPKPINDLTTKFSAEVRKIEAITRKNHKG